MGRLRQLPQSSPTSARPILTQLMASRASGPSPPSWNWNSYSSCCEPEPDNRPSASSTPSAPSRGRPAPWCRSISIPASQLRTTAHLETVKRQQHHDRQDHDGHHQPASVAPRRHCRARNTGISGILGNRSRFRASPSVFYPSIIPTFHHSDHPPATSSSRSRFSAGEHSAPALQTDLRPAPRTRGF